MKNSNSISKLDTPKRNGRIEKVNIVIPKGTIQDRIQKWGGLSASEMEKQTASNAEEYKRGQLCKSSLSRRTAIALKGFIRFKDGKDSTSEDDLFSYPVSLEDIDRYISHLLVKETSFKTSTIMQGHYYNLAALYRYRKGMNRNEAIEPLDIFIQSKLRTLAREHKRGRVSIMFSDMR